VILDRICDTVDKLGDDNIVKSYALSILSDTMKYKGYVLKENQKIILSKIINKKYTSIMVNFEKRIIEENLIELGNTKYLRKFI
jgi:hypothetical protein